MKPLHWLPLTVGAVLAATAALADPNHHSDNPGSNKPAFASGQPGSAGSVNRVIRVEASDNMAFSPDAWKIQPGDTVRFVVSNSGRIPHEFVIDTRRGNAEHREAMMDAMADGAMMAHDDPNAVSLQPGETEELVWTFTNGGTFEAACNLPGHYQAGMHAAIEVTAQDVAQN